MTGGAREPSFPTFVPTSAALIRHVADAWGERPFVALGGERLTYAEVERRSARLAKGMLASGVGKGTRVGLLAPNGPDWVVAWFAATRIGAVAVMLNTYNKAAELARTLRHGDVALLVTIGAHLGTDYLDRVEAAAGGLAEQRHRRLFVTELPYLRSIWAIDAAPRRWCGRLDDLAARGDDVPDAVLAAVEAEVHPSDPMVIVYSSGSTAEPKGAVHTHGGVVRHSHNLNQMRDIRSDDVLYTPMPLFWVGGFSFTLVAAMHAGAALVFEERFEPGATLDLIEAERVTQVLGWPHMAKALADHPTFGSRDLSAVRGGTLSTVPARGVPGAADAPRATSLGMTETLGPHTFDTTDDLPAGSTGSFGRSVPGVEHRVVDPETGTDVGIDATGELWVRGYPLMDSLNKRERADTLTADGWYRTGDAGFFDAFGHFHFTGRMGDLIKTSGMNVTPREVEAVIEAQPEVALAFVTAVPHPDRGEDVVAAVVVRAGESIEPDEVRARTKAALAAYKVPRHVVVHSSQADLPWLDSGKLDRRTLAARLRDRFGPDAAAQP